MKKKLLAFLLSVSMVATNIGYLDTAVYAAETEADLKQSDVTPGEGVIAVEDATKTSAEVTFTGLTGATEYTVERASDDGKFEAVKTISPGDGAEWIVNEEAANVLLQEDFEAGEDSKNKFVVFTAGRESAASIIKDTAKVNANETDGIYVLQQSSDSKDVMAYLDTSSLDRTGDSVVVEADIRMDAPATKKEVGFAILNSSYSQNWFTSEDSILTIKGTASITSNCVFGAITVNNVDITEKAIPSNANEERFLYTAGKKYDTTGWLKVVAKLNYETKKVDVSIIRISDNTEVYSDTVDFLNKDADKLQGIYIFNGKQYGSISVDNLSIREESLIDQYTFTDDELEAGTTYTYRLSAKVGDQTYASDTVEVTTVAEEPVKTPGEGTPGEGTPGEGTPGEGTPGEGTPSEGTEEPSTQKPSTEEPSTQKPSTEEPSTQKPSTEEPSTQKPSTEEPSTQKPSTEEPSTQEPGTEEPDTEKVLYSFDIGTKKGTAEGFIGIGTDEYDATKGYGFIKTVGTLDAGGKGTYVDTTGGALAAACGDVTFAADSTEGANELVFGVDVAAGKYRVDVYAGSLGASTGCTISVNGEDLGKVADGSSNTTPESIKKTATVTLEEDGQIVIDSLNEGGRAALSAIIITRLPKNAETPGTEEPGTETPGTEEPGTETPGTETPGTEEPGTEIPGEKADKSQLVLAIAAAKEIKEADYTANSYAAVAKAIADAEKVNADDNATQTEVNNAVTAINDAFKGLVQRGDKTELAKAIATAKGLKEADYTAESFAAVTKALADAEKVNADNNATQDDVNAAVVALNNAFSGLKPAEQTTETPGAAQGTPIKSGKNNFVVTTTAGGAPSVEFKGSTDTKVKIPATVVSNGVTYKVTSVAASAFKNNKKITSVTIGANVTKIGANAFSGCTKLKTVTIGKGVTEIGASAFKGCTALTKIKIPGNVKTVGANAFSGCKKLATVTIGAKVTSIGNGAFANCVALKKITVPNKVKKIGSKVFSGCKNLTSVTIGTGVTSIGAQAFKGCGKLTKITIKSTALKTVGKNAFKGINAKATIKVPGKKLAAYKNLLKGKGQGKNVKITK